jgi:hypothetical protein
MTISVDQPRSERDERTSHTVFQLSFNWPSMMA